MCVGVSYSWTLMPTKSLVNTLRVEYEVDNIKIYRIRSFQASSIFRVKFNDSQKTGRTFSLHSFNRYANLYPHTCPVPVPIGLKANQFLWPSATSVTNKVNLSTVWFRTYIPRHSMMQKYTSGSFLIFGHLITDTNAVIFSKGNATKLDMHYSAVIVTKAVDWMRDNMVEHCFWTAYCFC